MGYTAFRWCGAKLSLVALGFVAALSLGAPRAQAELLPPLDRVIAEDERPVLADVQMFMASRPGTAAEAITALDAMLARLGRPTPFRGVIQVFRASTLASLNRHQEALESADESIRLLPGYSAPLLVASHVHAFADRPAIATGYLLRASRADPEIVRTIDDYELSNLVTRLTQQNDTRNLRLLAERLFDIGWLGNDLTLRSSLGRTALISRIEAGNIAGARELIPRIISPSDTRALLIRNAYRDIWPDIERWAGPRQESQWRIYLTELKAVWETSGDTGDALAYFRALRAARHYDTLITELMPVMGEANATEDFQQVFIAPLLGEALGQRGRWDEVEAVFARAGDIWPLGSNANALNISANLARLRLQRGDASGALAVMDRTIEDAMQRRGEVSGQAFASMHLVRACALHELGRGEAADVSATMVVASGQPELIASLQLCLDRPDAARTALIAALEREATRDDVLDYVQIDDGPPYPSEISRRLAARRRALCADPELLAAVARHGRILPYSASVGAPPEDRIGTPLRDARLQAGIGLATSGALTVEALRVTGGGGATPSRS